MFKEYTANSPDEAVTCGGDKPQPVRGDRSVLRPVEACPVVAEALGIAPFDDVFECQEELLTVVAATVEKV
jgi:hypothetical protein